MQRISQLHRQVHRTGRWDGCPYSFSVMWQCKCASFLPEHNYVTFGSLLSQIRLSSVTSVRPTHGVETFGNISSLFCTLAMLWPRAKFYGDRPRETAPSGALNVRGIANRVMVDLGGSHTYLTFDYLISWRVSCFVEQKAPKCALVHAKLQHV